MCRAVLTFKGHPVKCETNEAKNHKNQQQQVRAEGNKKAGGENDLQKSLVSIENARKYFRFRTHLVEDV